MLKKKINHKSIIFTRYFLTVLVLTVFFGPVWGQQAASEKDTDIVIRNIDGLFDKAEPDIREAIRNEKIKDRVAITEVKVFDYTRSFQKKIKTYVAKHIEGIYDSQRYFRFLSSDKSLNRAVIDGKELQARFDEDLTTMANFAKELSADAYATINLVLEGKTTKLTITVRSVLDNKIVWQGEWRKVNFEKLLFFKLGFNLAASFDFQNLPIYLSLMVVKRSYGFFEWGFYFDNGASFFALENKQILNRITLFHTSGVKVGFEILDIAKVSYSGIEVLPTIRAGLAFSYIIKTDTSVRKKLEFSYLTALGMTLLFDRDWETSLEYDVINGFIYFGAGYRF